MVLTTNERLLAVPVLKVVNDLLVNYYEDVTPPKILPLPCTHTLLYNNYLTFNGKLDDYELKFLIYKIYSLKSDERLIPYLSDLLDLDLSIEFGDDTLYLTINTINFDKSSYLGQLTELMFELFFLGSDNPKVQIVIHNIEDSMELKVTHTYTYTYTYYMNQIVELKSGS